MRKRRFKDLSIATRIGLLTSGSMVLLLIAGGIYLYRVQTGSLQRYSDRLLSEEAHSLNQVIEMQIRERQVRLRTGLDLTLELLYSFGEITFGNSRQVTAIDYFTGDNTIVDVKQWKLGREQLYNNNEMADRISALGGIQVSLFQKTDKGYLNIATTVKDDNGERILNTLISANSPVIQAIERGEDFYDRSRLGDDWYLAASRAIMHNGKPVGMLFIGVPEKDVSIIRDLFSKKTYYDTGYPFLVDATGILLVHPT